MKRMRAAAILVGIMLLAASAMADATPQDQAAARALFDQGRALAEAGKH